MSDSGYTRFPNELFDLLLAKSSELSKREIVILLAIIRNTNGWNREKSQLSCRFIANATGIDHANVSKAIKNLEREGIILVDRSGLTAVISISQVWSNQPQVKSECGQIDNSSVVELTTEVLLNQPQKCGQIDNKQIHTKDILNTKTNTEAVPVLPDERADIFSLVH